MRKFAITLLAGFVVTLTGCEKDAPEPDGAAADVQAVRKSMLVTTDWLAAHLDDENLVVLHVAKGDTLYKTGHVPGARLVTWDDIAVARDGVLNEIPPADQLTAWVRRLGISGDSRIVLYDEYYGIPAARAYLVLDYLGLGDQAALLDGQWRKWHRERRELELSSPIVEPSNFTPKLNPGVVADLQEVLELVDQRQGGASQCALVDARPAEQYSGAEAGKEVDRAGHIPTATNAFSGLYVQSEQTPVLKSPDELRKLFSDAGASDGGSMITYCRTGGQASFAYFVAKYLGYSVRMYSGSFTEWQAQLDTAVEMLEQGE